jgi:hypothetical protein
MTSICTSTRVRYAVSPDVWYTAIDILKHDLARFLGHRMQDAIYQGVDGITRLAQVDRGTQKTLRGCQLNVSVVGPHVEDHRRRPNTPRSCDAVLVTLESAKWVCRSLFTRNTTCHRPPPTLTGLEVNDICNPIDISQCQYLRKLVLKKSHQYGSFPPRRSIDHTLKAAHCPELQHLHLVRIWDLVHMQDLVSDMSLDNVAILDVEFCTGLRSLHFGTNLRRLYLSGSMQFKHIDLRAATGLTTLCLHHMQDVAEIDVSAASGLQDINLYTMHTLTKINFGHHRELSDVRLGDLPCLSALIIPDTGSAKLKYLRVLGVPHLTELDTPRPSSALRLRDTPMLGESQLTSLITDTLEVLTLCDCGAVQSLTLGPSLLDLQIACLPTLRELHCTAALNLQRLKVTVLTNVVGAINVSGCMQLKFIDLGLDPMLRLENPGQGLDERSADIAGNPVTPVLVDQLEEWYNANQRHWLKGLSLVQSVLWRGCR